MLSILGKRSYQSRAKYCNYVVMLYSKLQKQTNQKGFAILVGLLEVRVGLLIHSALKLRGGRNSSHCTRRLGNGDGEDEGELGWWLMEGWYF